MDANIKIKGYLNSYNIYSTHKSCVLNFEPVIKQYLLKTRLGQLREIEMLFLLNNIQFPCRLLVFGMGHDSAIWTSFNQEGFTTFVEDDPEWIEKIKPDLSGNQFLIKQAKYWTDRENYREYYGDENLILNEVVDDFDFVFVDGPFGKPHGRCQSIATAARIQQNCGATVFVHDCHRSLEITYCDFYFPKTYIGIHHLRKYT
jgi:hypothetical protein